MLRIVVVVSVTLLPGCLFSVPVGDPETSTVDPALIGYWVSADGDKSFTLYTVVPGKDGHYYDFTEIVCDGTLQKPTKYLGSHAGIAWLAEIEGTRFVTCKISDNKSWPQGRRNRLKNRPYTIDKLELSKDKLLLTSLNADFSPFKDAKTRAEMEAAVAKNLKHPEAFDREPYECKRATEADVKEVLKVAETAKP